MSLQVVGRRKPSTAVLTPGVRCSIHMARASAKTDINKLTTSDELRHSMKAVRFCKCIQVGNVLNAMFSFGEARWSDELKGAVGQDKTKVAESIFVMLTVHCGIRPNTTGQNGWCYTALLHATEH